MRVKSSRRSAWCAACMCRWLNEESRDYDGMGLVSGGGMKGVLGGGERRTIFVFVSFFFVGIFTYCTVMAGSCHLWRCVEIGTIR